MTTAPEIHKFEKAGLGKAPFKFIGCWEMPSKEVQEKNPEGYNNALRDAGSFNKGCCAYCWTGITDHFILRSADGKVFAVGCDCIEKHGDKGLIVIANQKRNEKNNAKRHAREAILLEELKALMAAPATAAKLAMMPHPRNFINRETNEPLTAWDDAQWRHSCCGTSGRIALLKWLKKTLSEGA